MSAKRRLPEGIAERAEQLLQGQGHRPWAERSRYNIAEAVHRACCERGVSVSLADVEQAEWLTSDLAYGVPGHPIHARTTSDSIASILLAIEVLNWQEPAAEETCTPIRFLPDKQDHLDLRWFSEHGRTPKKLKERQRDRWRRVNRCLDGRGWRLRLYYTNLHGYHDPLLAVHTDEVRGEPPDERMT